MVSDFEKRQRDLVWLIRNGYEDVTEELKRSGMYPPDETKWSEWSMGGRYYVTAYKKFFRKE